MLKALNDQAEPASSVPASWRLLYKNGDQWIPVKNTTAYGLAKDQYNNVEFEPVTTTAIKMELQLPKDNSSGIHDWTVE